MITSAPDAQDEDQIDPVEAREIRLECLRMAVALEDESEIAMQMAIIFSDFVFSGVKTEAAGHDVH